MSAARTFLRWRGAARFAIADLESAPWPNLLLDVGGLDETIRERPPTRPKRTKYVAQQPVRSAHFSCGITSKGFLASLAWESSSAELISRVKLCPRFSSSKPIYATEAWWDVPPTTAKPRMEAALTAGSKQHTTNSQPVKARCMALDA